MSQLLIAILFETYYWGFVFFAIIFLVFDTPSWKGMLDGLINAAIWPWLVVEGAYKAIFK